MVPPFDMLFMISPFASAIPFKFLKFSMCASPIFVIIANNDYLMIKGSNATGLNNLSKKLIKGY